MASVRAITRLTGRSSVLRSSQGVLKNQKRFFEAPQELHTVTEISPWLGSGPSWKEQVYQLKNRMAEEKEYLTDEDVENLKYALRVAEHMMERQKNAVRFPYKSREEAGNDDEVASVYGNVGHKKGEEVYHRVREGFDTEQEIYQESALYGPFGTEENPVLVPSMSVNRFVGCFGGFDGFREHDLIWFRVMQGPKVRCPLCGQIFKLLTSNTSHPDHPFHDPSRDYRGEIIMSLLNDP